MYPFNSPCHPGVSACDLAYTCYVIHTQALEDAINELARRSDVANSIEMQRQILAAYGINIDALTTQEIQYIESEVAKRWES